MNKSNLQRLGLALTAVLTLFAARGWAQGTATPPATTPTPTSTAAPVSPTSDVDEEVILLSPFSVDATADADGYRATSTLAGTRVRTDLRDVASSISVVTEQFLRDIGATNNQTLLQYTTNTEVGGIYGNYTGAGNTFVDGASETGTFLKPNNNTRVRGLDSADNTRDYFQTDIPWDSYIVGRVDLQRGPNSILFGVGSPAGVINSSINTAGFATRGNVENRLGSFGSVRFSLDYNHVLLDDELAVRVAALDDDTKYRQDPAYNHDQRYFAAMQWSPKFLRSESAQTSIRANFESGKVRANRPRVMPPWDRISAFFDPNAINRRTWDPYYAWEAGIVSYSSTATIPGEQENYWLVQYPGPGVQATANPMFIYDSAGSVVPASMRQAGPTTYWGLGVRPVLDEDGAPVTDSNGNPVMESYRDGGINGFPYGSNIGIASFNEAANNHWRANGDTLYPAADKNFYKRFSLSDPSIFNFYNQLIDGPNKREWQNWDAYNIAVAQTFLNNRLGLEFVYDRQKYDDGQSRNLNDAYISVDIRSNLMDYPWAFPDLVRPNPNAGRAFVGSGSKNGGNNSNISDRDNIRVTLFGDVRASDFVDNPRLANILGRHLFTGLYSREIFKQETRNWVRYAVDDSWSERIGNGGNGTDPNTGDNDGGITQGDVNLDWVTYLSDDLRSRTTASGLNLGRIAALQSPHGTYQIPYFDSRWTGTVNPATPWLNPARNLATGGEATTESENPRNYAGWQTGSFTVLNADRGDLDRLYTDANRLRRVSDSKGVTWQGYFWDDTIVATVGWRRDTQKQRSGASSANDELSGVAQPNPPLQGLNPETGLAEGDSTSWGIVVHTPRAFRDKLPWRSNLSLTYSDGRNTRVENRYGYDGRPLPNSQGRTKDIGVVVSTLDDRLQFKATYYKTSVDDANLSSVTTEVSTLGNNTYYLRNLEGWGTASAMTYLRGRAGELPGVEWFWNWALVDSGWDGQYNDPNGAPFLNHPSTIAQTEAINSWLSQMQPAEWFAAYGFNINHAAAVAGDWRNAFPGWLPNNEIGAVQPSGGGRINGTWPTGTANNESKGVEFELVGQPFRNFQIAINASKTKAAQTSLGQSLIDFIEAQYAKYQTPAGNLRLWWGGGDPFRTTYTQNIWSAYQFQLQTNGKMVPEMSPWRFNLVTNYNFDSGAIKGVNVGLGYRWQDGRILGYALNDAEDNLDVDRPYWSDTEDWLDLWVGYERQLSERFRWRVQLNLRNVGESVRLLPLSVQPDGTPAAYRIQEGMTWQLTNTISF